MSAKLICAVLVIALLSAPVFAHLEGGQDNAVGSYIADFGYSPAPPVAGGKAIIAFNLLNATTRQLIVPDSVWVRISSGDEIFFAGTFHPEASHVAFTYTFGTGNYDIKARYRVGESVVESDFKLEVSGDKGGISAAAIAAGAILLLLPFAVLFKLSKK